MILHYHIYKSVGNILPNAVRRCAKCSRVETLLYDYEKKRWGWHRGMFYNIGLPIGVAAADLFAFRQCVILLKGDLSQWDFVYLTSENFSGSYSGLYFWGDWISNPDYQSEAFSSLLCAYSGGLYVRDHVRT